MDQLCKNLTLTHLALGADHPVAGGFLRWVHVHNSGFVFGLLERLPSALQESLLVGIPVFALVLILLIFIKLLDNQLLTSMALTTILGGATSNLVDRVARGYVVDYLQVGGKHFHLPPFNIADASIVLGVGIIFWTTLISGKEGPSGSVT